MLVDAGVKSDMRGLVTAGRTVLLERIACLTSSVILLPGNMITHSSVAGRSQALPPTRLWFGQLWGCWSLGVQDGQ